MDPTPRIQEQWNAPRGSVTDSMNVEFKTTPARSNLYGSLAELLSYPDERVRLICKNKLFGEQIQPQVQALPYANSIWSHYQNSNNDEGVSEDNINLESEYLRLFELSGSGEPCALYGGVYTGNRHKTMEELLRYYRLSGLSTEGASSRDMPDSIVTVIEFIQFLTYKEAVTLCVEERKAIRLTQKDILERHLTLWLPALITRLDEKNPIPFYGNVVRMLNSFAFAELHMLNSWGSVN